MLYLSRIINALHHLNTTQVSCKIYIKLYKICVKYASLANSADLTDIEYYCLHNHCHENLISHMNAYCWT
jgi:hypothetical protein